MRKGATSGHRSIWVRSVKQPIDISSVTQRQIVTGNANDEESGAYSGAPSNSARERFVERVPFIGSFDPPFDFIDDGPSTHGVRHHRQSIAAQLMSDEEAHETPVGASMLHVPTLTSSLHHESHRKIADSHGIQHFLDD